MVSPMELRHLRAFMAVAEELHFRRAAERLHMAQPPLSMMIQALEREVGVLLLRRTRRSVALTEAGALFLDETRRVLAGAERAVAVAREVERGEAGRLEVGFTGSACFNPCVPRLIRIFRERYPQVEVTLTEQNTLKLLDAVRNGVLDAAFLRPPVDQMAEVTVETFLEEEMVVALPAGHALSSKEALPLSALRGETILLRPRAVGIGLAEAVIAACRVAGFSPILGRQAAPQMSSILNLVAAGLGVSIVPASMQAMQPGEVIYRPLADAPTLRAPLALAHQPDHRNAATRNFTRIVREWRHTVMS